MQESEITEFMKKLKGTPAPYACPADACGKTYKTVSEILLKTYVCLNINEKFMLRPSDYNIT